MSFATYRNRVLLYTNGANIHKCNNLLHIVIGGIENLTYYKATNDQEQTQTYTRYVEQALLDISILTGVEAYLEDFFKE